jgi:hypothetical protein
MSNISIQGAATGTGVFTLASPATNTDRVLTLPDEAGTVLTSATPGVPVNGPAFSAYQSVAQTPTASAFTKVILQSELFDTNSNFDSTTNFRFTPTVGGYYQINGTTSVTGSATNLLVSIFKNGAEYIRGGAQASASFTGTAAAVIYMNGSTDYVEMYVFFTGTVYNTVNLALTTQLSGALVRAA